MSAPDISHLPPPAEPWRRRVLRALLYGKADRTMKARARIGLAILAFTAVYAIIAGRLVVYALTPDSHVARRIATDAVATARPDITDRKGEVLATDVNAPSLFGEPKRLIDVDEAVELLTAVMPDLDAKEVRERLGNKKRGFACSGARSRRNSSATSTSSAFRASASLTRTSASIRTAPRSRT